MSVSTENFIKTIYRQQQKAGADTRPGTIARLLKITHAAATDMSRKLAAKKLVNYSRYKQLSLTSEGEKLALMVIRKHRLWESFLYRTLKLSMHEIHQEAEMLEHATSDFLADRIEQYLGNPGFDPHGDPIPGCNGEVEDGQNQVILSEAGPGQTYEISRLFSSDKDFFDFCLSNHLLPGATLQVDRQYESNKMTEISIEQNKLLLNRDFAEVIYVTPQKQQK